MYILIAILGQCPHHFRAERLQKDLRVSTGNGFRKERFGVLEKTWNQNELSSGKGAVTFINEVRGHSEEL